MQVTSQPKEWRVFVHLDNEAEEATYVYDLIHSGRLLVENKEFLPLPFRGQFLLKLPAAPRSPCLGTSAHAACAKSASEAR